jgi:AcrR family transcriptional regulator
MKQRKKQPQLTRRTILESAGAEFSLHGYAGTGLGAVVTRAELTKGALFHHFSDKRAMAVAWINDLLGPQMEARWMAPLESIGSLEALKAFCRARCMELAPDDASSALVSCWSAANRKAGSTARFSQRPRRPSWFPRSPGSPSPPAPVRMRASAVSAPARWKDIWKPFARSDSRNQRMNPANGGA